MLKLFNILSRLILMKSVFTIFLVVIAVAGMHSCQVKTEKLVVESFDADSIENIDPPPVGVTRDNPVTFEQWFEHVCQQKKSPNDDVRFRLTFFEGDKARIVYIKDANDPLVPISDSINYSNIVKENAGTSQAMPNLSPIYRDRIKIIAENGNVKRSPLFHARSIAIKFDDGKVLRLK